MYNVDSCVLPLHAEHASLYSFLSRQRPCHLMRMTTGLTVIRFAYADLRLMFYCLFVIKVTEERSGEGARPLRRNFLILACICFSEVRLLLLYYKVVYAYITKFCLVPYSPLVSCMRL